MHAVLSKLDPKALLLSISGEKKKSLHMFCLELNHFSMLCMNSFLMDDWMLFTDNFATTYSIR